MGDASSGMLALEEAKKDADVTTTSTAAGSSAIDTLAGDASALVNAGDNIADASTSISEAIGAW